MSELSIGKELRKKETEHRRQGKETIRAQRARSKQERKETTEESFEKLSELFYGLGAAAVADLVKPVHFARRSSKMDKLFRRDDQFDVLTSVYQQGIGLGPVTRRIPHTLLYGPEDAIFLSVRRRDGTHKNVGVTSDQFLIHEWINEANKPPRHMPPFEPSVDESTARIFAENDIERIAIRWSDVYKQSTDSLKLLNETVDAVLEEKASS